MIRLNTLRARPGSTHYTKRLGRGTGSGHGNTAGKGDKGQKARRGGSKPRIGFEGGQTPLYRRLPKRGFKNPTRVSIAEVNVGVLEALDTAQLDLVSLESLRLAGVVKGRFDRLNILGNGALSKKCVVKAHRVTPAAKEKIEKAGGSVEIIPYNVKSSAVVQSQ